MKNLVKIITLILVLFSGGINAKELKIKKPTGATKTIIKYAVRDASGAIMGFQYCTPLAGPMGSAMGIVMGGIISSSYMYWDNHYKTASPKDLVDPITTYNNEFEKTGYLHNKFIVSFFNDNGSRITSKESFINQIYEPLLNFVSKEYKIDVSLLKSKISIELIEQSIDNFEKITELSDYSTIIANKYNNAQLGKEFELIVNNFSEASEISIESSIKYLTNYINTIESNSKFNSDEKLLLRYSCEILKHSFILWSNNL